MTDADIEAGLTDDLVDAVVAEINAVYGNRSGTLVMAVPTIALEMVTRLRAAGIGDAALRNALVHEPVRHRAYYAELARLHRELNRVRGDPEAERAVQLEIVGHRMTYNPKAKK